MKITKGPFAGKTVEFAPQSRVQKFAAEVDRILDALGYPDALVTDESILWDFCLEDHELRQLGETLGVAVTKESVIADIAEALRGVS